MQFDSVLRAVQRVLCALCAKKTSAQFFSLYTQHGSLTVSPDQGFSNHTASKTLGWRAVCWALGYSASAIQYRKPSLPLMRGTGGPPLKRVLNFTLHHDLHEKEPKLQKATMMSMKVHVSSLHAPIYRNFYLCVGNKINSNISMSSNPWKSTGLPVHRGRRNYRAN